ncbi:MAG: alpha/beta fold hydrolase [Bythopirellula sp.]
MEHIVADKTVYIATGNRELDPTRETVVFVHGAGQDHTIWVLPTRYFARHDRNVLAIDLPGHGRSEGPPLKSIEEMATWVLGVLDTVGLDKAAVVGHSMGSLVALECAAQAGDRVRAIALVGTAVPMPVSDQLLETSAANDHAALEMLALWGHSGSAHIGGSPNPGMWMLGTGLRLLERSAPGVVHADLNACNEYKNGLEQAKQVDCAALLVLGGRDAMTPTRATKGLEDALSHSESVILEGSGHALLSERPDEVLDALIRIV